MTAIRFHIEGFCALAPGICQDEEQKEWASVGSAVDPTAPLSFTKKLPMMTSRRLSKGCQLATEASLKILETHSVDAMVFSSRHAELARNEKLLKTIHEQRELSPTDFTMSVHNAASGTLSVSQKLKVPVSSIASGADTFHSGLLEAYGFLKSGLKHVLLVDFESIPPEILGSRLPHTYEPYPYGIAFLLTADEQWQADFEYGTEVKEPHEPSSVQLLRNLLNQKNTFKTEGSFSEVQWRQL